MASNDVPMEESDGDDELEALTSKVAALTLSVAELAAQNKATLSA